MSEQRKRLRSRFLAELAEAAENYKRKQREQAKKQKPKSKKVYCEQPPKPPLTFYPYSDYLQSEWWKWRRKKKIKKSGFKCELCGFKYCLHVHHLSYKNLGKEPDKDLQVLCKSCHYKQHQLDIQAKTHLSAIMSEDF